MNHIGRSFAVAFAFIVAVFLLLKTPIIGPVIHASLTDMSASLLGR